MTRALIWTCGNCISLGLMCAAAAPQQSPQVIRIPLGRIDNHEQGVGSGLTFEAERVAAARVATPVTLPDPMPPDARVGLLTAGNIFVLIDRVGPSSVGLTVDANGNHDLGDDARFEVVKRKRSGDGVVIPIRRTYAETPPRDVHLPYRFEYNPSINERGEVEPRVFVSPAYRMEGTFRAGGRDYVLQFFDFNMLGLFDRSNLSRGTVLSVRAADDPPENAASLWGHELIPLGDELYEVRDGALDGSWLEIVRNTLARAAIGRVVPDFRLTDTTGQAFELRDYRGRYLLLDFWPSWCQPCLQEFPTIKKTVEQYASQPLAVVGINLDSEKALPTARKIIAEKALSWRHVLEGRGYFLPIYQMLGRLPERRATFPLYVVIAPDGRIGYATNDFRKMQRFFDAVFAPPRARRETLFVPLVPERRLTPADPLPVEFTSTTSKTRLADPQVKLPADLPDDGQIGQLPNGMLIVVVAASRADRLLVRVDTNLDRNLADEDEVEIPILDHPPASPEEAAPVSMNMPYASGARSFRPFRFFARAPGAGSHAAPLMFYIGWKVTAAGTFERDGVEYQITITDPTRDLLFTSDDSRTQGFLTLKRKQGVGWVTLHTGVTKLPIAGQRFRLAHVHDDGELVVLER